MTDPMTTPPLDLPALRAIANAATQSEWTSYGYRVETVPALDLHRFDVMGEMVAECDLIEEDARHIAAFDPPTVLAILDRVEVSEAAHATARADRDLWRARAEAAEKKVAAVRELRNVWFRELENADHLVPLEDVIDATDRALDGTQ